MTLPGSFVEFMCRLKSAFDVLPVSFMDACKNGTLLKLPDFAAGSFIGTDGSFGRCTAVKVKN